MAKVKIWPDDTWVIISTAANWYRKETTRLIQEVGEGYGYILDPRLETIDLA